MSNDANTEVKANVIRDKFDGTLKGFLTLIANELSEDSNVLVVPLGPVVHASITVEGGNAYLALHIAAVPPLPTATGGENNETSPLN